MEQIKTQNGANEKSMFYYAHINTKEWVSRNVRILSPSYMLIHCKALGIEYLELELSYTFWMGDCYNYKTYERGLRAEEMLKLLIVCFACGRIWHAQHYMICRNTSKSIP